jgi:hypothetical protein
MLLIEEVQSDWHQAGRDKGYKSGKYTPEEIEKEKQQALAEGYRKEEVDAMPLDLLFMRRVPDAPMKDTWYQLALKRAIQVAAEQGYDRIGLTTGARQAERFDLSKQISRVVYNPETEMLNAFDKSNKSVVQESNVKPDQIGDYIGKEAAKRLFDEKNTKTDRRGGKDISYHELSGVDLKVGGEGMKKYYDEIYPKFLDKYGKKWGAKVGETKIRTHSDKQIQEDLDLLEQLGEDRSKLNSSGMEPVRYIDITPEMKASVSKGQPLFQAIPAIGTGGLLGAQEEQQ